MTAQTKEKHKECAFFYYNKKTRRYFHGTPAISEKHLVKDTNDDLILMGIVYNLNLFKEH
jgi:hypothetical protein